MDRPSQPAAALNGRIASSLSPFILFGTLCSWARSPRVSSLETPPLSRPRCSLPRAEINHVGCAPKPRNAPDNLPKEASCQVGFGISSSPT